MRNLKIENSLSRLLRSRKGQAGPIGEDLISIAVTIMIIGLLLVIVTKVFVDHEVETSGIEKYRVAGIIADKLSVDWGWDNSGVVHSRVLDATKLTISNCPDFPYEMEVNVINQKTGEKKLHCGDLEDDKIQTRVRLPVTIRESHKEFYPGILEVRVAI